MAKEQKTAEELDAQLHERIERYQLQGGPRWIKIVPADPETEGANWKVSYGSGTAPDSKLADAINRVMPELQKLYDLKES